MVLTPKTGLLSILGLRPTGDLGPLTCYTSKRGKIVWFLKAPPTCPPSGWQTDQRNKFRIVGMAWQALTDAQREQWSLAEHRGRLSITGYNLFLWWSLGGDPGIIRTIQRDTETNLIT